MTEADNVPDDTSPKPGEFQYGTDEPDGTYAIFYLDHEGAVRTHRVAASGETPLGFHHLRLIGVYQQIVDRPDLHSSMRYHTLISEGYQRNQPAWERFDATVEALTGYLREHDDTPPTLIDGKFTRRTPEGTALGQFALNEDALPLYLAVARERLADLLGPVDG